MCDVINGKANDDRQGEIAKENPKGLLERVSRQCAVVDMAARSKHQERKADCCQ